LGQYAFFYCHSLKSINVPPNIKTIQGSTFFNCIGLTNVSFSEGLEAIGRDTFGLCKSLVSVALPSSAKVIGKEAFERCKVLNEVHLPDAIENIGKAFKNCNITHFRLPPLITNVDLGILDGNPSLISIELSENVSLIGDTAYTKLFALRNIALPLPSDCEINVDLLRRNRACPDLEKAFDDEETARDALQHRFDNLPIHKICYYQSYNDNETTMQSLRGEINPWSSNPPSQLNTKGKDQDCLGMTPLHILACSTKPTIEMFRLLIDKYPETLIMNDKWGDIPLLYAFWCNAPTEVLDLLVESYKTSHPDYEFDWSGMLRTLTDHNAPLPNIQRLVNTQQDSFPHQDYDIQQAVLQVVFNRGCGRKPPTSIETFKYLLRISITERLELLSISSWCVDMENSISNLDCIPEVSAIYDKLATYESIKEATSVLELALWKAKIDESRNKRARGEDVSYKEQCRVNCGADIIIRNVLPYLC